LRFSRNNILILFAAILIVIAVFTIPQPSNSVNNPIQHVVIIMLENRSFDEYFGTYPGANGIPPDVCVPYNPNDLTKGCVKPYLTTRYTENDLPHNYVSTTQSINNGSMNGYIIADNGDNTTMAYKDYKTIPYYWTFANRYVLADNFYSSVRGWSLPNHWFAVAGTAPEISVDNIITKSNNLTATKYLEEADDIETVPDLLENATGITWTYYSNTTGIVENGYTRAVKSGTAFNFWNPFSAKQTSYTHQYVPHFASTQQVMNDIANNNLPQVSWVMPNVYASDHPPWSSRIAMIWTTNLIDSIMQSPAWKSTAIFVVWDDYGGFYDHAKPPNIDTYGPGIRIPALIISPYAKTGYIDHTQYEFESMLKFIEWRFNLPSLNDRDSNATAPLNAFDFSQQPKPPNPIRLSANNLAELVPITIKPDVVHAGAITKIVVNGFSGGDKVSVYYDGNISGTAIANATGSITYRLVVPNSTPGCHKITYAEQIGSTQLPQSPLSACINVVH
jgi:phospholipase C